MEVGSPEWIEASLARLDDLERQRDAHETALEDADDPAVLKQHTEALERLDGEIKQLYAQLESIADDDDDGDEQGEAEDDVEAAAAPVATQGDDELSAPHVTASVEAPLAAPVAAAVAAPVAADNPFGSPPADFGGGGGGFDTPAPAVVITDDDLKPKGTGAKWAFLALVVLAGAGVGGYFAWQKSQAAKPAEAAAPAGPATVIQAAEVPDDTEEHKGAPSGTALISPNANQGESAASKKKKKEDEKKAKPIKLKDDGGPL